MKYIGEDVADELASLYDRCFTHFTELLFAISSETSLDSRQLDILIKIGFFESFGNQRELHRIVEFFEKFKKGEAKQIKKELVDGTPLEPIVKKYAIGTTKSGGEAKSYTLLDVASILDEVEDYIKSLNLPDVSLLIRVSNFADCMGYVGYTTGKDEDRRKLYIIDTFPTIRRRDGQQFGTTILTKSIGSGVEARFTIKTRDFNKNPVKKGEIILCKNFERNGAYFGMVAEDYERVF